ncbi:(2Fe-2S) ferredoxin domain-containing protein [Synechococcus sp. MU1643]|uniref:(2Fe-2S) ferredoxin domain-containing protein n=1 Tax=Synechococcus sp. MU1643 TaxID=2508349 RepID=UPI001CF84EF7|nr:(2Fe-2S) ferredoxin domain-containing protein [Synechococcus sp. MU1643]MCB4427239.1 (2Fe-2S) ferredoxin domain-containing protein [Synechococcus sp. MU1643]
MQRISHHLLLCATATQAKCCDSALGAQTWNELKSVVRELNLENTERPEGIVLRSKADCLRVCERGPILLVWPDGIWYADVSPDRIKRIVEQHIICQQPVEEWILKRTPFEKINDLPAGKI